MFYYYGAKRRHAGKYPPPLDGVPIVEPFAGSGAYACRHLLRDQNATAILIEKDPEIVHVWRRILGTPAHEIARWPVPAVGERTSDRFVMLAMASNAVASCRTLTVTTRVHKEAIRMRDRIARQVDALRDRLAVLEGDYRDAPRIQATWFVDPPYIGRTRRGTKTSAPGGEGYARGCRASDLNIDDLASFCRSRPGRTIVCEAGDAAWLPFRPLYVTDDTVGKPSAELIWTDPDTARGNWHGCCLQR